MRKVIGGSHISEQMKEGDAHFISKHWQPVHSKNIVHTQRSKESTLSCHVCTCNDIKLFILYIEVVAHGFFAQKRVVNGACRVGYTAIIYDYCRVSYIFIQTESSH